MGRIILLLLAPTRAWYREESSERDDDA